MQLSELIKNKLMPEISRLKNLYNEIQVINQDQQEPFLQLLQITPQYRKTIPIKQETHDNIQFSLSSVEQAQLKTFLFARLPDNKDLLYLKNQLPYLEYLEHLKTQFFNQTSYKKTISLQDTLLELLKSVEQQVRTVEMTNLKWEEKNKN